MAKVTMKLLVPTAHTDGTDSKQDNHDGYDIYKMKEKFDMSANVPTISMILNYIVQEILSLSDCDNAERLSHYFKKIKLRYLDEDGDFVVIQNDKDLIDAIESILEHNDNPKRTSVKIYIRHNLQSVIDVRENHEDILMDKTKTKKKINNNKNSQEDKDDVNQKMFEQFRDTTNNGNDCKQYGNRDSINNSNTNSGSGRIKERRDVRLQMVGETVYVLLYQKELEPEPSNNNNNNNNNSINYNSDDDETQVLGLFLCEEEAWERATDQMLSDLNSLRNSSRAIRETHEKYYQSAKNIAETNRAKSAKQMYWIVRQQVVNAFGDGNEPYCWVTARKIQLRHN